MANDMYFNRGRLLALTEATYGTDAVAAALTAGDALAYNEARSVSITPALDRIKTTRTRSSMSGVPDAVLKNHSIVEIEHPITGPGAAGTTPSYAALLKAALFTETVSAGTSVTYKPGTTQGAGTSLTAYHWTRMVEEYRFRLAYATGVRGNLGFNFGLDDEAFLTFSGLGANFPEDSSAASNPHFWSEDLAFFDASGNVALGADGAAATTLGDETYADRGKMIPRSMTVTAGGTVVELAGFNLNLNLTAQPKRITGADPVTSKVLLGRAPSDNVTAEATLAETGTGFEKLVDTWLSAGEIAVSLVLSNTTDRLTVTMPKVQVDTLAIQDSNGFAQWTVPLVLSGDYGASILGDNDLTWVYDAAP